MPFFGSIFKIKEKHLTVLHTCQNTCTHGPRQIRRQNKRSTDHQNGYHLRLLAFDLEFVSEDDVIVTADVDAFIMTADILKPLRLKVEFQDFFLNKQVL